MLIMRSVVSCRWPQVKNRALTQEVEQLTDKLTKLQVDHQAMEIMQRVMKSLGNKPDTLRALANMRAAMQAQVKEINQKSQAEQDKFRHTVATQGALLANFHDYLDKLSEITGIDTSDRPGGVRKRTKLAGLLRKANFGPSLTDAIRMIKQGDSVSVGRSSDGAAPAQSLSAARSTLVTPGDATVVQDDDIPKAPSMKSSFLSALKAKPALPTVQEVNTPSKASPVPSLRDATPAELAGSPVMFEVDTAATFGDEAQLPMADFGDDAPLPVQQPRACILVESLAGSLH